MTTSRQNIVALLVLLSMPAIATDYTVEYSGGLPPAPIYGELTDDQFFGDSTFHRPLAACDGTPLRADYRYDTITLMNTGSNDVDVDFEINTGFCNDTHDSVVYGYSGFFDPDVPNANCFVYEDDTGPGDCSRLVATLVPNQVTVFVVTSYEPNQTWPWVASFNDHLYEDDFDCVSEDIFNCATPP